MFSNSVAFAIVLIAAAFYYSHLEKAEQDNNATGTIESQIVSSWRAIIKAGRESQYFQLKSKIAVGVNVNADLIVPGTDVLRKIGMAPSNSAAIHSVITSLEDFEETFSYSLKNGAAVERIFAEKQDFLKVVQAADSLDQKQYFVGGNAALAALKMATDAPHLKVLLVGPCGPQVRDLLPDNMVIPKNSAMATDEVHLIMEYQRGERWGGYEAKVATRFITSYDVSNTEMTLLGVFAQNVKEFSPDAVFFSGLHLLDGQPAETKTTKLAAVNAQLKQLPVGLPIHLELASMADSALIEGIYNEVLSSVHSLGLNEQELSFVSAVNSGPHPELYIREGYPEVGAVADVLYWLLSSTTQPVVPTPGGKSNAPSMTPKLSRVHFHSLSFHIVATLSGTWNNSEAAVAAGARIAGRQACDDGKIVDEKVELRMPRRFALSINDPALRQTIAEISPAKAVLAWTRGNVEFHLSPVLVCKRPVKTVGLGDAISATGFLYSQYVS
ncbi:ADP-dependent glucokinase-like [Diadema antillarum]|uniref:ADP-dependent glucokinase-like n=1 Tax=Diadema antillarum TaxID=105358 RepID=UPI003A8B18BB